MDGNILKGISKDQFFLQIEDMLEHTDGSDNDTAMRNILGAVEPRDSGDLYTIVFTQVMLPPSNPKLARRLLLQAMSNIREMHGWKDGE